jgi:hypothetical protein
MSAEKSGDGIAVRHRISTDQRMAGHVVLLQPIGDKGKDPVAGIDLGAAGRASAIMSPIGKALKHYRLGHRNGS